MARLSGKVVNQSISRWKEVFLIYVEKNLSAIVIVYLCTKGRKKLCGWECGGKRVRAISVVYAFAKICIYKCIYMYIYISSYMYICMCIHIHIYVNLCIYIHIYTYIYL